MKEGVVAGQLLGKRVNAIGDGMAFLMSRRPEFFSA